MNLATVQHIFRQIKGLKKTGVSFQDLMDALMMKDNEMETN